MRGIYTKILLVCSFTVAKPLYEWQSHSWFVFYVGNAPLLVCSPYHNIATFHHMLCFTWLNMTLGTEFMTYQRHIACFFTWISNGSSKIFLSLFCQDFIPTFSVCLYQIDLMMYHLLLLFDDNSGIRSTGRKLLSWAFISSVHSSSLISLNVVLNLDRKLV